ncbi:phenoloxidase-activating factor 2-like [Malaya genurostris]|uniref:phenoloxidase-activating factor 2-like n=1 Tax=Malaya genurostris TaxID=325434 RepID=UPI0026F3CFC8|nr:phenoloxidase-activating factor 2-like [Malaya genurostris]
MWWPFLLSLVFPANVAASSSKLFASSMVENSLTVAARTDSPRNQPDIAGCLKGQRCVPKHRCTNFSTAGSGLLDIRFKNENPCGDFSLLCCEEQDIIKYTANRTSRVLSGPSIKQPSCGKRNTDGIHFRIIGHRNNEAEYGEFPWMIAVMMKEKALNQVVNVYISGGSLIHPKVVLTCAHCIQTRSPDQLKVRAGEWDTQSKNEILPHQDRLVTETITHPDYFTAGLYNDIALLFLETSFDMNQGIQTICLPPVGVQFDHQRCFASGWGKDSYGKSGSYQIVLKKIELPVVPSDQCQTLLRGTRLGHRFRLHESFICAGGEEGKDACEGDGGSPLVCPVEGSQGHYYQTGIVAWGIGCGVSQTPGVYVNVAHFRIWIDREMGTRRLETGSYSVEVI